MKCIKYISKKGIIYSFYILFLVFSFFFCLLSKDLPSPELLNKNQLLSSKVLDRNGKLLFRFYEDENRTPITLSKVSPHFLNAIIAIEDKDFYSHYGISITGILRSVWHNITAKNSLRGGSTITQQLVKNRLLSSEKSYSRKLREIILAIQVEMEFSKDQILEMYLNDIAFGGVTYGVEEASRFFFDKSASELNIAESALLAGLPQAPTKYNPMGNSPRLAYVRMNQVLRRMLQEKFISEDEYQVAKKTKFRFNNRGIKIKAPHFVMYVKKLLLKQFSKKQLYESGMLIKTSLDLELHNKVQEVVTKNVNRLLGFGLVMALR